MNVLLAGATGALGIPLTRQLLARGHQVLGLTRGPAGAARLRALGARPVVADALDRDGLLRSVEGLTADAVIHELTALKQPPLRHRGMVRTDRLRTEGTANLLAAAELLGARPFLTQSFVLGYGYRDHGGRVLTERDPFGEAAGDRNDPHLAAMRSTELQAWSAPEGIALRYGLLYGADADRLRPMLATRRLPVADGGVVGWVHHEDAAAATVAALERGRAGQAYNIVDDRPAGGVHRDGHRPRGPAPAPVARMVGATGRTVRRLDRRGLPAAGVQRQGDGRAGLVAVVPHLRRGDPGHRLFNDR